MQLNFKKIIFIVLLLFFSGCGFLAKKEAKLNQQPPSWYINSPSNNSIFIYGVGSGYDLDEAKHNALNNLSARLIVSIKSSIETKKVSSGDYYNKEINQNIKIDTQKIKFNNVKVEKSVKRGDRYFVLVKVDREKLYNNRLKEFQNYDNEIKLNLQNLNKKNILEQIILLNNLKPKILKNKQRAYILYAINNEFDYSKYYEQYNKILNKIDLLKSKIIFKIVATEDEFKDAIISLINKSGFKVGKNNNILIRLDSNIRYSKYRGWQIARVSTSIKLIADNKIYVEKTINSIGRSSSSHKEAKARAANEFKRKIEKIGLEKLLNFK